VQLPFFKYQGAGNDFIMIDNRSGAFDFLSIEQIKTLCDRHFGIGSDGLIKINAHPSSDFYMDFYNPDGSKSFCGNGARCAVAFFIHLTEKHPVITFEAIDGFHEAFVEENNSIRLKMKDLILGKLNDSLVYEINTGSPHLVLFESTIDQLDVYLKGSTIRYSEKYKQQGINVNFIEELSSNSIAIRTYERGVENETLACGTGITAAAIAYGLKNNLQGKNSISVTALGGNLSVEFDQIETGDFRDIYLIGPAKFVFKGEYELYV
jgi:diaminopimelate epimerase